MKPEDFKAEWNGKATQLNYYLAERQGLDDATMEQLIETHIERLQIFEMMENTDDVEQLKRLAKDFRNLEFEQQALWGFDRNEDFHRWFNVPKCSCPKLDNMDFIGTEYNIYVDNCPIHGDEVRKADD
jgi:hypothetical protein